MRILIVEDDAVTRLVAKGFLDDAGLRGLEVGSAEDGLARLSAGENVELCLVDIVLPGMDGLEFCRRVKASEEHRNLPVIVMTGLSDGGEVEQAFAAGAMDFIRKPVQRAELIARVRAALRLKREIDARLRNEDALMELTRLLGETNRELQEHLRVDSVTGLASRRELDAALERIWGVAAQSAKTVQMILFDVDYFKNYNDTYGHPAGDNCLHRVAGALQGTLSRPDELAARYGGEEFAIVLPDTTPALAAEMGELVRTRVFELNLPHAGSPLGRVTISGGVAGLTPQPNVPSRRLLERADQALYAAKRMGRNRVEVMEGA